MNEAEAARTKFRHIVREMAALDGLPAQEDPDARQYNAKASELRSLVQQWGESGRDILLPLLTDDPRTRGIAAAFLLRLGGTDQALTVLKELADDDESYGRVALDADTALMIWEREQG